MPTSRYSLFSVLLAITAIAFWLATSQMGEVGYTLRGVYVIFLFAIPIYGVAFHKDRTRAFWVGFLIIVVLLFGWDFGVFERLGWSRFHNLAYVICRPLEGSEIHHWAIHTIWLGGWALLRSLGGIIAMRFYGDGKLDEPRR